MDSIREKLLGREILWHGTGWDNAQAISEVGFRPSPRGSHHNFRQATWFYHSTSFEGEVTDKGAHFMLAVDLSQFRRGVDFTHEMDDTIVFQVPLPAENIVARIDAPRGPLLEALGDVWECDGVTLLSELCLDTAVPWNDRRAVAEILWTLAPDHYLDVGTPEHILAYEVTGLRGDAGNHLISRLRASAPRYLNSLLRLYHRVFLTPRLARAAMVAGARHLDPVEVLSIADGSVGADSADAERATVANFLAAVLSQLPPTELLRGAIEMAAMRHFPGDAEAVEAIARWAIQHAANGDPTAAENVAIHYILFGGDTYPTRHSAGVAIDISTRILRETGQDYFERLLEQGDTGNHTMVGGLVRAFGLLRETRAVPFIANQLSDNRKMVRVSAINALGMIDTPAAQSAILSVAGDKRKVVRTAVDRALGR